MRKVLSLFKWTTGLGVRKTKQYALAHVEILLPLKPEVRQTTKEIILSYLRHDGMFMVESWQEVRGRQVVHVSCFRHAAHVVQTDI